ncbi:hypothetical protein DICSQDRAFT_172675 [Dichomitus squalens LYAD-421 SS1]|uniref:Uncharacterized protein n=1 Tax=Dichomitus squalens (strain LYAD-421) TaxID=732165 RepID=R7SS01_DICSQ|nr:uncharacterized protein DICSQDRAFT_172675 [Dichomitus squalens LYAD-421 SS1]EJF58851.1 hypothetical protein DICSQDRAFT_172675 [Dichomitus squalens LYAD-421 SS1]
MPQLASTYRAAPEDVPTPQWFLDHDFHLSFLRLPGNEIAGYEQVDHEHERTWLEHVIANNDSHAASPIPPTLPLPAPEWGNPADISGWGDTNVDWSNTDWGNVPMNEADMEWSPPIQPPRCSPPPRNSPSPTPQHLRPMPARLRSGAPPPTRTRPSPRSPSPTPYSPSPVDENEPPFAMVVDPAGGDLTDTTDPDTLSVPPDPPTPPLRQRTPCTPPYPTPAPGPTTVHYWTPLLGHPAYGGPSSTTSDSRTAGKSGQKNPVTYAWDERWEQIPGIDNAYLIGVLSDNLHPSGRFTETQYLGFLRAMIQARNPAARVTDHKVWREAADNLVDAYDVRNIPVSVRQYWNRHAVRLYNNTSGNDLHRSVWGNFYDDEILDVSGYGDSPPPTPATPAAPVEEVLRSRSPSPPPAASSPIALSSSCAITFIARGYFNPIDPGLNIDLWYPPAPSSPLTEPDLDLNDRDDRA